MERNNSQELESYVDMIERILGNHKNKMEGQSAQIFNDVSTQPSSMYHSQPDEENKQEDINAVIEEEEDMNLDQMMQQVVSEQADYAEDRDEDDEDEEDPIASVTFAGNQ